MTFYLSWTRLREGSLRGGLILVERTRCTGQHRPTTGPGVFECQIKTGLGKLQGTRIECARDEHDAVFAKAGT